MKKLTLLSLAIVLTAACQDAPKDEQMTIVVREDSKRVEEEKTRLANEREKIESLKAELDQAEKSIRKISDQPGETQNKADLQSLLQNLKKLRVQQDKLYRQRSKSLDEREKLLQKMQARLQNKAPPVASAGDPAQSQQIAALSKGQDKLKQQLDDVNSSLRAIQGQLAAMSGKINSAPVVVAAPAIHPDPTGKPVKRSLVNKRYRKARNQLRKKGLLIEDLPPSYQGHNAAIRKALKAGDTSTANELVTQLLQIIKATKIDGAFINAKLARISARMQRSKLDKARKTKVTTLFQATTRNVTDGKFKLANRKLNELAALLVDDDG